MLHALLAVTVLLAIGLALRARLRVLQVLYMPASVVAGAIGFAVAQGLLRLPATHAPARAVWDVLFDWPGNLIAIVFAGLLLERPGGKSVGESLRRGARSAALAWIIILGQISLGLVVYAAIVRPAHPEIPGAFGQLLEVSWAGGHGSSAAMGKVYEGLGFPAGRDVAFFLATTGLIYGVVSGLVLVNVAVRRGWTAGATRGGIPVVTGLEPRRDPPATMFARTRTEVLDPLTLQALILLGAFGVGYAIQRAFVWLTIDLVGVTDADVARGIDNVPLFLFTLLGGWVVRRLLRALAVDDLIDTPSLRRLQGLAMDVLIVAAVTTMRVDALRQFFVPVVLLIVLGGAWAAFSLLVLAPRLLPRAYWFELGLLNYGFSTANTPQGLMLLRIVDPELKTGAAEDYAVAAPLSAPFVGGGVLTVAVFPWVLAHVSPWIAISVLMISIVALYVLARRSSNPV